MIYLHFPEKNSIYFGQRKHQSPWLRKKNKCQGGKKMSFSRPTCRISGRKTQASRLHQQQVLPIEVCLRAAAWEMYHLPKKKIFLGKMANKDKQSFWSNMRAEVTALLSHRLISHPLLLAPAVVLISLLTSLMWRKLTDTAKELKGTETRRKICFSSKTVNQLTNTVKIYQSYCSLFSVSFVNLCNCFAFYMVGFYKFFHLHLILHSKS